MDTIFRFFTTRLDNSNDHFSDLYDRLPLGMHEFMDPVPEHDFDIASGPKESLLSQAEKVWQKQAKEVAERNTTSGQKEGDLALKEARAYEQRTKVAPWSRPGADTQSTESSQTLIEPREHYNEYDEEEEDSQLDVCKQLAFVEQQQDRANQEKEYRHSSCYEDALGYYS